MGTNSPLPVLALALFTSMATPHTQASVITWTNGSGGNWNVAANWSPNQVPSTDDTAVITNIGTYTVTLNINPMIGGLIIGGTSGSQTLNTAGHNLTLNGQGAIRPNGVLSLLSTSTLAGTNHIAVQGVLNWGGGTLASNTAVTLATGAQLNIASAANYSKFLDGNLTNAGTITWQPTGGLRIAGVLHNLPGGVLDAKLDLALSRAGPGIINNDGTFRKSAGTGSLNFQVPMLNNGIVDIQTGRLTLADGSVLNNGCAFTGTGATWLDSGTITLNGNVHSENLVLRYNAMLTGTGGISGTLTWGGGVIGSNAALSVATNGHLLIASEYTYEKALQGHLTNAGTIAWQPSGSLIVGGLLHNLSSSIFDIRFDGTLGQSGTGMIVNEGVIRKSVGASTLSCLAPLLNQGTVDTQTGALTLAAGSSLNDGASFIGAGQTILSTGTNLINGAIHSENLSLQYSATLNGSGSFSGTLTWGGGDLGYNANVTVATNGTLLIASAGNFAKNIFGRLTNAGTIVWRPQGTLVLGGLLHNQRGALFDAQLAGLISQPGDGVFVNEGIFQKSGPGTVTCDAAFINHGTTKVASGIFHLSSAYSNPGGTIALEGGTFRSTPALRLENGLLTGWGTVLADVTNGGCIRPANSNGGLTITGKCEQLLEGRMEFDLAGNVPGTNQSRLNITGAATLRGTIGIRWVDGYLPPPGTNFQVLAFGSRRGEFSCFDNFFLLGLNRRLVPVYTTTNLSLATLAAPDPIYPPLRLSLENGSLVCWPVEFTGYQLYFSTNLAQANWTLLPEATNRWFELPPLPPEKFFRLREL